MKHHILAKGSIRTITEIEDNQWTIAQGAEPVNTTLRYMLCTRHGDFDVDVAFSHNMSETIFSSGTINVKNSIKTGDQKGLEGFRETNCPLQTPKFTPNNIPGHLCT